MGKLDKLSIFISLALRHKPEAANITLDAHGWADVNELLAGIRATGRDIDRGVLELIVKTDQKQRYSFSPDKTRIRANQGHSVPVDVGLEEVLPPETLYHGTAEQFLIHIWKEGLQPMNRLYVHLSLDRKTAENVGRRHGKPVILAVSSGQMSRDGIKFYRSKNNVWLVKAVSTRYLVRI